MKFDNNILNELQTLSPLLAGIPRNNVFIVPRGYFETISETILLCIKEETGAINNSATVDVPKGYFDNLSATILDKIKAQQENNSTEEIKALSPLLHSLQQTNVFEVPQEYFESLDSAVADKIKVQQDAVAAEEIKVLSPLLHSLKQTNVFEVPTGYFTSLPAKVLHAVNATTTAKVVRIPKLRLIVKYAAAAAITGLMVLGVYKYADKPAKSAPAVSFAKPDPSIEKGKQMNDQQFNEALNNLSKDDITSYLEKNGSEEDMSLLTSIVDVNDLPDKNDYLLDDKTLDNYLNKIELQN